MVRYSISMDDTLTEKIDKACEQKKISRSDWISEACTGHLTTRAVNPACTLPAPGTFRHNMEDYDATYRDFRIDVPEYFNFGFDVIDAWAKKDRNKLAMIWTNQKGEEKKFTFWDLMRLSNQIVNMLIKYGVSKGDRVMIMLPRVPEWWIATIALIKRGAVYCPAPTMLTEHDLKYRINAAEIKMVITSQDQADKIDAIIKECPSLTCRFMIDGKREGWISYPVELDYPAPVSTKLVNLPGMKKTKATDPMVIFFTSVPPARQRWWSTPRVMRWAISSPPGSGTTSTKTTSTSRSRIPAGQRVRGGNCTARGWRGPQSSCTISGDGSTQPSSCR